MSQSLPATDWRQLIAQVKAEGPVMLERLVKIGQGLDPGQWKRLVNAFIGSDGVLACGIVVWGRTASQDVIDAFHPLVSQVLKSMAANDMADTPAAHHAINLALIAESAGVSLATGIDGRLLKPLISARRNFSDRDLRSMALTALALRDTTAGLAFLGDKPARYDEPRLSFQFNIYELVRYLAATLDQRRPADWVEPAWLEYLQLFPLHLAADAAKWPDLFMFARVLAELRGDKIADIADDLHARVSRLAEEAE